MTVERIILVPPAGPGSRGDEGMLRGALALIEGVPVTVINPEPGTTWLPLLQEGGRDPEMLAEVACPIRDFRDQLRPDDLVFLIGADVVDGTCGLDPAMARIELMAEAVSLGLPTLVTCSFRSIVHPTILQSLRLSPDIRFLIREADSLENFQRQTGLAAEFFPDLSFFKGANSSSEVAEARAVIIEARQHLAPVIGLNFAEHSFRSFHDTHDEAHREIFVDSVLSELTQAHPAAFFVLFSNDSRTWDNHPSDTVYCDMASHWINRRLGAGRHLNLPETWTYGANMALCAEMDFVITGRMHLSLAAFQVGTLPLVLMGEGKGYTSVDKMRGAFVQNMGLTCGVVTEIGALQSRLAEIMGQRALIGEKMAEASRKRAEDLVAARETFFRVLAAGAAGQSPNRARTEIMEPPLDPLMAPVLHGSRPAPDKFREYRSHHLLAAHSVLLSEHRARRSARLPRHRLEDPLRIRRILVADYRLPRPDVSAGERSTFGLIADLLDAGFEVTFLPADMAGTAPYRQDLTELGVEVISSECGYAFAEDYLGAEGHKFGTFYLIRVEVAWALLATARSVAPDARVIFHAPDLCHLRELRGAELSGDPLAQAEAEKTRDRETAIMQAADHIVLVSPAELPYLAEILPRDRISVFPALYSPVAVESAGHAARSHIFFLGGFKHLPNIEAVQWFVDKVWPLIRARLPEAEFHIIGAEAPKKVQALGQRPGVRFVGYVRDLSPVLAEYRLSVAPLLYGAGIKGKLGMAMGAGVPCVSTTIGAEGMGIVDGLHALVRDDAEGFAAAVIDLYGDAALWEEISNHGQRLIEERFGNAANRSAFFRVLDRAGSLPLDLYVEWCKAATLGPLPAPDAAEPVDVSIIVPVYNQWSFTRDCLVSIQRALHGSGLTCEVILADDASTDQTQDAGTLFPGLRVVRQQTNLGLLRNCNAAAATARGAALLFLDNDTIVLPGWLTELVRLLREEPSAAIVGSKLLYPDGTIQEIGGVLFSDGSAGNLGRGKLRREALFSVDREIDYASEASILVRRSFWDEVGGFDTRYAPPYCKASDLAMAARARGMRVLCAAHSEVVQFEHATYGEDVAVVPKALAVTNGQVLRQKWAAQFAEDHMAPATKPEIAAAHAERHPFEAALARRAGGKLNVLYFSPFPSHPDNHGNQATIQAFGRHFQKMGHKVHFGLLQSHMYDEASLAAMRAAWDSFTILPNSKPLWADGREIPFDDWYQPGLGEKIRLLCDMHNIDLVFCSYVFQSKLLEFVPAHVLKVIDTHDKMGDRYEMLRQKGQPREFFSCTPAEEGAYLRRADIVVARRAEEADYFNNVTGRDSAIVIPHIEEPRFLKRRFYKLANVGMVASANRINLAITLDFLRALERATRNDQMPVQLHVAGQIKDMIGILPAADQALFVRPWVTLHGFVPDIAAFYGQMDLIVSPVTMGTGINVKTVQAMAFGMPLMTTAWGSKGIETGNRYHCYETADELAADLIAMAEHPVALEPLAEVSREHYIRFFNESLAGFDTLVCGARSRQ